MSRVNGHAPKVSPPPRKECEPAPPPQKVKTPAATTAASPAKNPARVGPNHGPRACSEDGKTGSAASALVAEQIKQIEVARSTNTPSKKSGIPQSAAVSANGAGARPVAPGPQAVAPGPQAVAPNPPLPPMTRPTQGRTWVSDKRPEDWNAPRTPQEANRVMWVENYVGQRFKAGPGRQEAYNIIRATLNEYGGGHPWIEQGVRKALPALISSKAMPDEAEALTTLRDIYNEGRHGAVVSPMRSTGLTPKASLEARTLDAAGRQSFSDTMELVSLLAGMTASKNSGRSDAAFRTKAEAKIRDIAESLGQNNVRDITIVARDPKAIIVGTRQEPSASSDGLAFDVTWRSRYGDVPIMSRVTVWANGGMFARVGLPYNDTKGLPKVPAQANGGMQGLLNPTSFQNVSRIGLGEAGMQGRVGLDTRHRQEQFTNMGFSVVFRGPHAKLVNDINPNPTPLDDGTPGKKYTRNWSGNVGFDLSGFVSLGIFRFQSY